MPEEATGRRCKYRPTGYHSDMAFEETKSKAKAKVASWYAETRKLEAELTGNKAKLKALQASDKLVDKIGDLPLIGEHTEFIQQQMDAYVAEAQADVDNTEAELLVVRSKLETAKAAKDAVDSVSDTVDDVKDGWNQMSADASAKISDTADSVSKSAKKSSKKAQKKVKGK